jgi:cell wall-associated NlpC family hydrolase
MRTSSKTLAGLALALSVTVPGLVSAPSATAADRPAPIHVHTSTNILAFRSSHTGAFRFRVTAHHQSGKVAAGKARVYVNGRHLQTRTLHNGRALFKVDRSRLPDNRRVRVKVRVIPWNRDIGHRVVTRTVRDNRPVVRATNGQKVVRVAKSQIGDPYAYGSAGPSSFDCSGLIQYAYRHATGKRLPHSSAALRRAGRPVSSPRPGDVVWTPGHVSVYAGGGRVVEAAKPGTRVRLVKRWQRNPVYLRF